MCPSTTLILAASRLKWIQETSLLKNKNGVLAISTIGILYLSFPEESSGATVDSQELICSWSLKGIPTCLEVMPNTHGFVIGDDKGGIGYWLLP